VLVEKSAKEGIPLEKEESGLPWTEVRERKSNTGDRELEISNNWGGQ